MSLAGKLAGDLAGDLSGSLATVEDDVATPLEVLGGNLALEYDVARGHTLNGSDIDSLACQITGHVVSAAAAGNRPAYTTSDADFLGYPSYTTSEAGADGLFSAAAHGSDLIAAAASPYVALLAKLSVNTGGTRRIWTLYSAASLTNPLTCLSVVTTGVTQILVNSVTVDLDTPTDAVHLFEWIYDGSGNLEYWRDNVLIEENATVAAATAVRRVAFGCRGDNTGHGTGKYAYFIACTAAPTAQQRADLLPFWRARGAPV